MKRNINIDIIRAIAIFLIMINHYWGIVSNATLSNNPVVDFFFRFGGEIGVTLFFLLSGFGLYFSLEKLDNAGQLNFVTHMKRRMHRILPQYWGFLIISIFLLDGAYLLDGNGIKDLLCHFLLIHNLFPTYAGSINGPLWALGTIFQFYLFAIPIYKLVKKNVWITGIGTIIFTVLSKLLVFRYILPSFGLGVQYNFWAGRNLLPTVLDNFVLGMCLANVIYRKKKIKNNLFNYLLVVIMAIITYGTYMMGMKYGIHQNNVSGYMFHSISALVLVILLWGWASIDIHDNNPLVKVMLMISHCEYGIYIWHYYVAKNIATKVPWIKEVCGNGHSEIVYSILIAMALIWGGIYTKIMSGDGTLLKGDKYYEKKQQNS